MIIELYILYQIITIGFFITAYFTKQHILWAIACVFSGMMMVNSYTDTSFGNPIQLMAINLLFFLLSIIYGFYDIIDKYGWKFPLFKRKNKKEELM